MADESETLLKWTAQLKVTPAELTSKLQGDKIILPPLALQQLLSAATAIVSTEEPQAQSRLFNPLNPYSYVSEVQSRVEHVERFQQLPHPLTFRLVNPTNGNVIYAGIREFSANDGEVGISPFLRNTLGLWPKNDDSNGEANDTELPSLTVHAQQLPKGTYARFRPLEAGYDPDDWKALLERYLRNTFTTLTSGEIFAISSGREEYRFLIDKLAPEGDGVCIVDTDLEVDIEALNEEQARETLKRRLDKSKRVAGADGSSSIGVEVTIEKEITGQVQPGDYVDYTLKEWDRAMDIVIEANAAEGEYVDLLVSPLSSRQRHRPREDEHVFGDLNGRSQKRIAVAHSNIELDLAESLYISVHGYSSNQDAGDSNPPSPSLPMSYSLRISYSEQVAFQNGHFIDESTRSQDEAQCKNCRQWVPQRTMMLHENFCFRNNVYCPHCQEVIKKSSDEWKNHWHCPHDSAHGNTPSSQRKHERLHHTSWTCQNCGYEAVNTLDLAHHRTTTCPEKEILCRFCHLLVPQQGPDDLSPSSPEVILSSLTPHEFSEGGRTTECHMCGKITRLRDMAVHLRHHDLERLSRITPRICRNVNCGRTMDGIGANGDVKRPQPSKNEVGLCDVCYGPLYNSSFDPEGKALKRRVERRYLTQLLTGCGNDWCRNGYCKTGRKHVGLEKPGEPVTSKEAMAMIKPILADLLHSRSSLSFCTDETGQQRRVLAEFLTAEGGYDLPWSIAALEASAGDLDKARTWLRNWAPTKAETSRG
jgi:hypothetical protein